MFVACRQSAERISDLSESTNNKPLLLLNKHVSKQFPCPYEKGGTELNWSIEERVPGYNKVETIVINERLLFAVKYYLDTVVGVILDILPSFIYYIQTR